MDMMRFRCIMRSENLSNFVYRKWLTIRMIAVEIVRLRGFHLLVEWKCPYCLRCHFACSCKHSIILSLYGKAQSAYHRSHRLHLVTSISMSVCVSASERTKAFDIIQLILFELFVYIYKLTVSKHLHSHLNYVCLHYDTDVASTKCSCRCYPHKNTYLASLRRLYTQYTVQVMFFLWKIGKYFHTEWIKWCEMTVGIWRWFSLHNDDIISYHCANIVIKRIQLPNIFYFIYIKR